MIHKIKDDPFLIFYLITGAISILYYKLTHNFLIGKGFKIIGVPLIDIRRNSSIQLGKNITLRSRNKGYHINIPSRCKLFTDPGAHIKIGHNTRIYGSCIHASKSIIIGENCLIAGNVNIIDRNGHELCMDNPEKRINTIDKSREIVIEDNVWIGANCLILPGSFISEGSVIMANSVVNSRFNNKSLIGGVPAIALKEYL